MLCSRRRRKIATVVFLIVLLLIFPLGYRQKPPTRNGWKSPNNCPQCKPREPLLYSELSSNLLLVIVHAAASRRDRREVLRRTWLSGYRNEDDAPIRYMFVIGGNNISRSTTKALLQESRQHNDLLILNDITDSPFSLTQRTLRMLQVVSSSEQEFNYLLKCDDDSYVDLPRVASELQQREQKGRLYWGEMVTWKLLTEGPYAELEYHVCDMYTPYAVGGGYILSSDLVHLIATNAAHLGTFMNEDVSLASWLVPYNMERVHDARFDTGSETRGCKEPFLISHKVTMEEIELYFKSHKLEGSFCSWRNFENKGDGYIYDWLKLPSQEYNWLPQYP